MNRPSKFLVVLLVLVGLQKCSGVSYELMKDDTVCLILDTTATLSVAYFNTSGHPEVAMLSLGEAAGVTGQCDSESQGGTQARVNLTFPGYWLDMQFASAVGKASLTALTLTINVQNGTAFVNPNATGVRTLTAKPSLALSPDTEYFACMSTIRLAFAEAPAGSLLSLANTKLQAFKVVNDSLSDKFATCPEDATTAAPDTTVTTMAPPTTTSSAPAEPPLLNFTVKDPATDVTCLRLQLRATFAISYSVKSGGSALVRVPMPADTVATGGNCGNGSSQSIRLGFRGGAWQSEVTFAKQEGGGYALRYLQLQYELSPDLFPNATEPGQKRSSVGNQTYFSVGSGSGYYTCASAETYKLDTLVAMETRDLRAQAFRTDNGTDPFNGSAVQCLDDTPIDNVVPIVVGAALAGLVIVVLIAYLIGRRRHNSGGGYQSV